METITKVLNGLPIIKPSKDPAVALVVGFLFGGVGLGIYLKSFVDFLAPIVALFVLLFVGMGAQVESLSFIGGALFAAAYGYLRVQNSNERLTVSAAHPAGHADTTALAG